MDTHIINECEDLSWSNKASFPEIIMKLASTGVERYIADLVGLQKLYFGADSEAYTKKWNTNLPKVAVDFCAETVQNAIKDSQQKKIDYKTFLERIILAGCSHYEVFILGKKVIYFGRDGSEHTEHFPKSE